MPEDDITNDRRASWAEAALLVFGRTTGLVKQQLGDNEDVFLVVSDLLADLAHWCDSNRVDLQAAIRHATKHYQTETGSRGRQLIAGKL